MPITATKPTGSIRWADVSGDVVEPASGKRDVGWVDGEEPPAEYMNSLQLHTYEWQQYLEDATDQLDTTKLDKVSAGAQTVASAVSVTGALTAIGGVDTSAIRSFLLGVIAVGSGDKLRPVDASGQQLGDATHRWNLSAGTVDASGLITATGGMTTSAAVKPSITNNHDIGDSAHRYRKGFLVDLDMSGAASITGVVGVGGDISTSGNVKPTLDGGSDLGDSLHRFGDGWISTVRFDSTRPLALAKVENCVLASAYISTTGSPAVATGASYNVFGVTGSAGTYRVSFVSAVKASNGINDTPSVTLSCASSSTPFVATYVWFNTAALDVYIWNLSTGLLAANDFSLTITGTAP